MIAGASAAPCGDSGLIEAATIDGATLCTTGPEPGDPPVAASGGPAAEATAGIQCFGTGTDGARVRLVYAHPASVNRFSSLQAMMRKRAAQMDNIFNASAAQTGGRRHIRFRTDADCNIDIVNLTVDPSVLPATNIRGLINAMSARGYDDPDTKYVIWAETNGANPNTCSGLATLYADTRPVAENWNNTLPGYARLDETCLRTVFDGRTEAHELMHTIGGVQSAAPNGTPAGHCTDEGDRMCYDDDGSGPVRTRAVCSSSNELRFDCRNDDYFYAGAPCGAGGFLVNHWNSADSRWLEARPASGVTPPPNDRPTSATRLTGYSGSISGTNIGASVDSAEVAPSGKAGGHSVWYSWTAPVSGRMSFDTCGSDTDTLLGVYTGSPSSPSTLVPLDQADDDPLMGSQGRVSFTATAGASYLFNVDGKDGGQGAIDLRWGAPFHGYSDVRLGVWYEAGVNWAKRYGIIDPATARAFGPTSAMVRSQAVDALWRLADRPVERTTRTFTDVAAGAPYRTALSWAVEAGLTAGYADGSYRPNSVVKRGQFVSMLWNLVGRPTGSRPAGFRDVAPTSKLAPAVDWAKAQGLVAPFSGGTFRANTTLTRQQVTSMLFDLASRRAAWDHYPEPVPSSVVFAH